MLNLKKGKIPPNISRKHLKCLIALSITFIISLLVTLISNKEPHDDGTQKLPKLRLERSFNISKNFKIPSEAEFRQKAIQKKIKTISGRVKNLMIEKLGNQPTANESNYNAYIFYYSWYKTEKEDGNWSHWNNNFLPNWIKDDKLLSFGLHKPPSDIGSNYYPELGCYSSRNKTVIDIHFSQIKKTGIGVVVVSWWPPSEDDSPDDVFQLLLDTAATYKLKIAPQIHVYKDRNPINLKKHIQYLFNNFGFHEAYHKIHKKGLDYPVYFIYDSYKTNAALWRELLTKRGNLSVRGTIYDGIFLGLFVDSNHRYAIKKSNFDGFYTYFANNGFSYGSTWKNWPSLMKFAKLNKLIFIPCIGPGYVDSAVRPWNTANIRHRLHGNYYEVGWRSGLSVNPEALGITSFNQWHEGTQIEPAVRATTVSRSYLDYEPEGSNFYLDLTQWWIHKFTKSLKQNKRINLNGFIKTHKKQT